MERAAKAYLARLDKLARDGKDIEIINKRADELNEQAMDVLDYQGLP